MKRRSTPSSGRIPRGQLHLVPRGLIGGFPSDELLAQVREHADLGERVRLQRHGFRAYDVVRNDTAFLVLPVVGRLTPIGTYANVCAALTAGDAYVEAVRRGEYDAEDGDDFHPGAA